MLRASWEEDRGKAFILKKKSSCHYSGFGYPMKEPLEIFLLLNPWHKFWCIWAPAVTREKNVTKFLLFFLLIHRKAFANSSSLD